MKLYVSTYTKGGMRGYLSFTKNKFGYDDGELILLCEIEIDDSLIPSEDQIEAAIVEATADCREKRIAALKAKQEELQKEIEELVQ